MRCFILAIALFSLERLPAQEEFIPPPSKFITKVPFRILTGGIILIKAQLLPFSDSLNFILDNDKFEDKEYLGESNNLRYLRFISNDTELDEKDLRWIWYKDDSDKDNLNRPMEKVGSNPILTTIKKEK
jgi:hypothetical protein